MKDPKTGTQTTLTFIPTEGARYRAGLLVRVLLVVGGFAYLIAPIVGLVWR